MFQTLWPKRVTMSWHLCHSTLSEPHQIQWVWIHFCCPSNSLLWGTDVLKYELCVYSPALFKATGIMLQSDIPSQANAIQGWIHPSKYSNPPGCQLHLQWRCSDPKKIHGKLGRLNGHCVESILSISKKKYDQPKLFLFDGYPGGPSTKTILIWDGRSHLAVTLLIWKSTLLKKDFLSIKVNQLGYIFVGWWNGDTYWDWLEAYWRVFNGGSPLQLQV